MLRKLGIVPLALLACAVWGLAGGISIVPSDLTPLPGTALTLRAEGAPSGASFYWDFGGDGTVDLVSQSPEVTYTARAGWQEVVVQVVQEGVAIDSARLAIVADERLGAFRIVKGCDPVEVTIVVRAKAHIVAPGIEESIPPGWTVEIVDDGGAFYKLKSNTLQAVWPLELWTGYEVRLRYLLYPPAPGAVARLHGSASAYAAEGGRIEIRIGGSVVVP